MTIQPSLPIPFPIPSLQLWILTVPRKGSCQHHWSVGVKPLSRTLGWAERPDIGGSGSCVTTPGHSPKSTTRFFGARFLESVFVVFNVEWRDDSAVEKKNIMALAALGCSIAKKKNVDGKWWMNWISVKKITSIVALEKKKPDDTPTFCSSIWQSQSYQLLHIFWAALNFNCVFLLAHPKKNPLEMTRTPYFYWNFGWKGGNFM